MLKLKNQDLAPLFISLILLTLFTNSCRICDPAWRYKIIDPYHENTYHQEYVYRSYPLNIILTAMNSGFYTNVYLQITTPCDSIKIYPASAYIESPYSLDTTHFPTYTIESLPKDSLSASKHNINKDGVSGPYFLHKENKLLVNLTFESYAPHVKRDRTKPISQKSDFIFHYNIFNNNNPLTFTFKPVNYKTEK